MASSSGNASGSSSSSSTPLMTQNPGSNQEDLQLLMDQRKRKRMHSNRESARRSRMRKQKHLDDLMSQVSQIKKDNQILTSISITTQQLMSFESENSILRAQLLELTQRLDSLNEILNFVNTTNNAILDTTAAAQFMMNNPMNQPMVASPDIFQYY